MKKTIFLLLSLVSFTLLHADLRAGPDGSATGNNNLDNRVNVVCSPDLYDLTSKWVKDYSVQNPDFQINLIKVSHDEFTERLNMGSTLAFISSPNYKSIEEKSNWSVVIGREIIVPVINSNNPFMDQINQAGLSIKELAEILENPDIKGWGALNEKIENKPVHYYKVQNEIIESAIEKFTDQSQTIARGIVVNNPKELVLAVQNDPFGMGFCKLTDIMDPEGNGILKGISLLPIDKNANGQIDYFETIYKNLNDFSRGIWIGKYPKTLISNLLLVSKGIPESKPETDFAKWVLTNGQQFLEPFGYSGLVYNERLGALDRLNNQKVYIETTENTYAIQEFVIFGLIILLAIVITINIFLRRKRSKSIALQQNSSNNTELINTNSITIPNGLYFDKTHTWLFMEQDGIVKIGIDDFLQHITGNFSRIIMKKPGDQVKKNEYLMSLVQDGKQLKIYSPISGTIIKINKSLVTEPSLINSSPYNSGWMYMIKPSNWLREIHFFRMAGKQKEWLKHEFIRIKDFLAASANSGIKGNPQFAIQDGGELKNNVLKDLGPHIWEDFQKIFIDTSI
ncbi:MAG: hypothetical protein K8R53_15255 [Bacteroidales bacterium]|nr:hypothetical protein [Bacteroidales bacterium]